MRDCVIECLPVLVLLMYVDNIYTILKAHLNFISSAVCNGYIISISRLLSVGF